MPFDASPEFDVFTFSPGKEGLRKLAYVLRHPEMWRSHRWVYSVTEERNECGTSGCAIGVARCVWPEARSLLPTRVAGLEEHISAVFAMDEIDAERLFLLGTFATQTNMITAEDVADAIDRYLVTGKVS